MSTKHNLIILLFIFVQINCFKLANNLPQQPMLADCKHQQEKANDFEDKNPVKINHEFGASTEASTSQTITSEPSHSKTEQISSEPNIGHALGATLKSTSTSNDESKPPNEDAVTNRIDNMEESREFSETKPTNAPDNTLDVSPSSSTIVPPTSPPTTKSPDKTTLEPSDETTTHSSTIASTATTSGTISPMPASTPAKKPAAESLIDCFNNGVRVVLDNGQVICKCPPEFYGLRCQFRNYCKTIVVPGLTGDQVCKRINRDCDAENDKFFRCICRGDEYFVFKVGQSSLSKNQPSNNKDSQSTFAYDSLMPLDSLVANGIDQQIRPTDKMQHQKRQADKLQQQQHQQQRQTYLAECRPTNKCLGVRCRQMSEVCQEGRCICNRNMGYIEDPNDHLCKLLDPCRMPRDEDKRPICGQAKCVATYDRELYRCVCPVGYKAIKTGEKKSSTQCAFLTDDVCEIPLLNKCQHKCKIVDRHSSEYKCSCLNGYKPGTRPGIDDHLCFFDEHPTDHLDGLGSEQMYSERYHHFGDTLANNGYGHGGSRSIQSDSSSQKVEFVFRAYPLDVLHSTPPSVHQMDSTRHQFSYDDTTNNNGQHVASNSMADNDRRNQYEQSQESHNHDMESESASANLDIPLRRINSRNLIIKREPVRSSSPVGGGINISGNYGDKARQYGRSKEYGGARLDENSYYGSDDDEEEINFSLLTSQERCNMYCEDNKICVLEKGTPDSYRCECERQGYVSIGDRCLDFCTASEFSDQHKARLEKVCYSGLCRPIDSRPWPFGKAGAKAGGSNDPANKRAEHNNEESIRLMRESSWRPTFECDCSTSPLLQQDPDTRLCQLDFQKIIEPCLPGNEGYIDCVENKNAYCSVFHRPTGFFLRDLLRDPPPPIETQGSASVANGLLGKPDTLIGGQKVQQSGGEKQQQQQANNGKKGSKMKPDKLYTCVCAPEKKFLVDKPRNKARCINECDLLRNECGRFNMMCRNATIDPNEFNRWSSGTGLVGFIDEEFRMSPFKKTKCECLPGFNVDPSEPVLYSTKSDQTDAIDEHHPGISIKEIAADGSDEQEIGQSLGGGGAGGALLDILHPHPQQQQQQQQQLHTSGRPPISSTLLDPYLSLPGELEVSELAGLAKAGKHLSIESRCLLDFDVVEFHATFKAPANFEPSWVTIGNTIPLELEPPNQATGSVPTNNPEGPQMGDNESKQKNLSHANAPRETETVNSHATSVNSDDHDDENQIIDETSDALPSDIEPRSQDVSGDTKSARGSEKQQTTTGSTTCKTSNECLLKVPKYMREDISEFHKSVVLVAQCDYALASLSLEAYQECVRYRYWMAQKLRNHFADWREIMTQHLQETFDLMDGNIRLRVNECKATIKRLATIPKAFTDSLERPSSETEIINEKDYYAKVLLPDKVKQKEFKEARVSTSPMVAEFDPLDQYALIDADVDCELTIHSASNNWRKVLLEKQLPKFVVKENEEYGPHYYLMAPNILIHRESFDQLARHRKPFSPCQSSYAYCDSQTRCEKVDTVNFSCTCKYGFTPIGSRHIYQFDSRKEVCEDIDECLFDVCKENGLENKSTCYNEIGDYRCQCDRHYVGDNKRHCTHICTLLACKFGECRIFDEHHAYCECQEGYREADCSVQDPSVALRKANMIIVGSIFTSILLLAIALAFSLNSQLKKAKQKLKRIEAAYEAAQLFDMPHQQPFRPRLSKASGCS